MELNEEFEALMNKGMSPDVKKSLEQLTEEEKDGRYVKSEAGQSEDGK